MLPFGELVTVRILRFAPAYDIKTLSLLKPLEKTIIISTFDEKTSNKNKNAIGPSPKRTLNVVNPQPGHMTSTPVVLSPALPSELLTYILNFHAHPTTLIICSTKADFLASLTNAVRHENTRTQDDTEPNAQEQERPDAPGRPDSRVSHAFLSSPLYQVAISRHIRTVYIPTVTHLRAYLSVFSPQDSRVTAPPPSFTATEHDRPPHLIIYGAIELHRDTSEWSVQGLSNTAATVVETGRRLGWHVVMIEPRGHSEDGMASPYQRLLNDTLPMLSGGAWRMGLDSDEGGWVGRTVLVGRVLSRWFRFQRGYWDDES